MNGDYDRSDESSLRERAREAIRAGRLPNRPADGTWGGPGVGVDCTICRAPVTRDEVEIEIEFGRNDPAPGGDKYRVHVRCFAAWEFELDQMQSNAPLAMAGAPPDLIPDARAGSQRALPGRTDGRKISGRGQDKTYRRGPG